MHVALVLLIVACGGGSGSDGSDKRPPGSCQEVHDNSAEQCPDGPWLREMCEDDMHQLEPTGCQAWTDWVSCASHTTYTCEGGFVDCEAEWQGTAQCRAGLAATGCVRVPKVDTDCSAPAPFAFSCFGSPPTTECSPVETMADVQYFCCPALD